MLTVSSWSPAEIIFRSPALMASYWKNSQSTQTALRDAWYHSGDLGTIDADGGRSPSWASP